jgi:hypothetical protein
MVHRYCNELNTQQGRLSRDASTAGWAYEMDVNDETKQNVSAHMSRTHAHCAQRSSEASAADSAYSQWAAKNATSSFNASFVGLVCCVRDGSRFQRCNTQTVVERDTTQRLDPVRRRSAATQQPDRTNATNLQCGRDLCME